MLFLQKTLHLKQRTDDNKSDVSSKETTPLYSNINLCIIKHVIFCFFQKHIFEQHIFPFTNIDQTFSKQKKMAI